MASGSNAPFSGEFVDLENVPKLPEGISAEQIFEQNADAIRQAAEARHAAGLSQINADGGFFDAFVDRSKVQTATDVSISSNLQAVLSKIFIDDFEDTDLSEYNTDLSIDVSFETENPIQGTQSLQISTTEQAEISRPNLGGIKPERFSLSARIDKLDSGNEANFELTIQDGFSLLVIFSIRGNGELEINFDGVVRKIVSEGQRLDIDFKNIDFSSETYDIVVNGENFGQFSFFDNGIDSITKFEVGLRADANPQETVTVIDAIETSLGGIKSSGTLTEKEFTFTDTQGDAFSPSKVGIFPDQTLNGQSISYDLKDSSGTVVKTFNQSDLNQLQSVSTTDTTFQVEANFSGNGSQTPELEFLDVRGV